MSNKMALDALTAALDAMEHMANTLNNMDAVDEDEDAQHDAAFEAVRVAIAELKKPQKSRIVAAPMASYPEADQRFFNFWYGHMFEDLMQPPLVGIDHATARYIWNAAAIAALQAEPQPIDTAPKDGTEILAWREDCGWFVAKWTCVNDLRTTSDRDRDELDEETLFAFDGNETIRETCTAVSFLDFDIFTTYADKVFEVTEYRKWYRRTSS